MPSGVRTLTHGELFAGISGFGYGFEQANIKTLWHVEIDPACRQVLSHHYPDALIREDVRECGAHNLPPVDIITFGSPCQDLSVAGKRKGLDGERSGLFFEAIRIIRELRPAIAIWENVPGAFSSNHGRDFAAALDALADSGALDIAWRVLDAQWFGVPQRRRRVFVITDFRGERAGEILFERHSLSGDTPPRREAGAVVTTGLTGSFGNGGADDNKAQAKWLVAHTLRAEGTDASEDGTGRGTPLVAFDTTQITSAANYSNPKPGDPCHPLAAGAHAPAVAFSSKDYGNDAGELAPTLRSMNYDKSHINGGGQVAVAFTNRGIATDGSAGTPRAASHGALPMVSHQMAVRRLTPTECSRLQAFPDSWLDIPGLSDSAKYRMLGNAVNGAVSTWLARRIVAYVEGAA